jgi:YidC/Oxa1 family membrane protein insertase
MGVLWSGFLEIFQVSLFWITQFYGGQLAPAIISFSIIARLVLLPATIQLALRGRAHARRIKVLRPALGRVRERWSEDPERMMKETMAVYERADVKPMDVGLLRGSLVQMPIFLGLFHAVRGAVETASQGFLWVANIARPDMGIAVLAAALMGVSSVAGATESQPTWTLALPALMTGVMALTLSAGFGLYLAATGLTGTLQGLIIRRIEAGQRSSAASV